MTWPGVHPGIVTLDSFDESLADTVALGAADRCEAGDEVERGGEIDGLSCGVGRAVVGEPLHRLWAAAIVPDHPVAQRLAVHAHEARSSLAAQPVGRCGDGQQPPGNPRVAFNLRQPTKLDRGKILAKQQGVHERPLDAMSADESRPTGSAQAPVSGLQPVGISHRSGQSGLA